MSIHGTPAQVVKKARLLKGLTQSQFGGEIRRPQSLVSKYERGLVEPPGHIIMHCMTIVGVGERADVSSADVARLIESRLASPDFAKLRSALAELIESVPPMVPMHQRAK